DMGKIVSRLGDDCFEAHRGAFWWQEDRHVAIAFGNDGYSGDGRARAEVEALRHLIAEMGGKELGFATDPEDGYSWALAFELKGAGVVDVVEAFRWWAWNEVPRQKAAGQPLAVQWRKFEMGKLSWDRIKAILDHEEIGSLAELDTSTQGNIARATLERNGLV